MSQSKLIPETEREKYTRDPPDGILNVKYYKYKRRWSDALEIGGLTWAFSVEKKNRKGKEVVYSMLMPITRLVPSWNIELTAEYIVLHGSDPSKNVSQMHHHLLGGSIKYSAADNGCYLLPLEDLLDEEKGYSGVVQLRLTIMHGLRCNPVFDFSSSFLHSDVVLMIEGKPVHVNKQYLGIYSPVFQSMFFGEFAEKGKDEIELKDVEYKNFIELLHVIYPSHRNIRDSYVSDLLKLADRLLIKIVIQSDKDGSRRHFVQSNPAFDFSSSGDIRADVALIIEGKPVHVNKQFLGIYSPVFQAMFFGELAEKGKDEIELKDVDYEKFIEFLQVIYPSQNNITDGSAEYLIELAARFQITSVIHRAVDVLISSKKHSPVEKIRIADQHKLHRLMGETLHTLKKIEDVQAIKNDPIYEGLSEATKIALREKQIDFAERNVADFAF